MKARLLIGGLLMVLTMAMMAEAQLYIKRDLSKIQYGMTTDEVRGIFGKPDYINTYGGQRGEIQQWVYKEGRYKDLYLYFENGKLTSYQRFGEK